MDKDKRGLSDVVTTVIIIALALVAITIVWIVVQNLISSNAQSIKVQQACLNSEFEIGGEILSSSKVRITITRNSGQDPFNGIDFYAYNSSNSEKISLEIPEEISVGRKISQEIEIENITYVSAVPYMEEDSKTFYCPEIRFVFTEEGSSTGIKTGNGGIGGGDPNEGIVDEDEMNEDDGEEEDPGRFSSESSSCSEWTMFGRDLGNTRYAPCDGPENISSEVLKTPRHEAYINSNFLVHGGFLYFLYQDLGLYQYNISTMEKTGEIYGIRYSVGNPTIAGEYLYYSGTTVSQFYASNLSLVKEKKITREDMGRPGTIPYVDSGYLYIICENGIYKLDALTLENVDKYLFNIPKRNAEMSLVISEGYIYTYIGYTGTENGKRILQINVSSMELTNSYELEEYVLSPLSAHKGYLYFFDGNINNATLKKMDVSTGEFVGEFNVGGRAFIGYEFAITDEYIYIHDSSGLLSRLNISNLEKTTSYVNKASGYPFVVGKNYIYIVVMTSGLCEIHQLNISNFEVVEVWKANYVPFTIGRLVIADGYLFAVAHANDKNIHRFG